MHENWRFPFVLDTRKRVYLFITLLVCLSIYGYIEQSAWSSGDSMDHDGSFYHRLLSYESQKVDLNVDLTHRSHHKDLFPMDTADGFGFTLIAIGLMIAASGGIGGGGMLVPLLILIFEFPPKYAIPLSNFTIVGSSITNMILNLSKRHPDADRPLVDWDLILVMEPLTMVGAIVGAFLAKTLPDWFLSISLVVLLCFTTKKTLDKGINQWNSESKKFAEEEKGMLSQAAAEDLEASETKGLLSEEDEDGAANEDAGMKELQETAKRDAAIKAKAYDKAEKEKKGKGKTGKKGGKGSIEVEVDVDAEQIEMVNMEAAAEMESQEARVVADKNKAELDLLIDSERVTPRNKLAVMSGMVIAVIVLNMLKGGKKNVFPSPIGIECGSQSYWMMQLLVIVLVLCVSYWSRNELLSKWRAKTRLDYKYAPGDVEWNERNTIIYPCLCFFAGLFAGMFGVGGGIVKGPLMLQMGVHPLVASATCAVMIMFTSVAATAMFVAFGTLTWDYALFLFTIGLFFTAVGQFGVSYLVKKYRRISLVSLSIGAVVAISTALMALQTIFSMTNPSSAPKTSNSVCG